jgi:PilZ domain
MVYGEPLELDKATSCLRGYGRADVTLQTHLETPHGRVRCRVVDLSIGGARVETDQIIEVGESLWLSLHKARVFGTVQWVRGTEIGVQFEQKLPKALVLSLKGESVDPKALEAVEAMLVAQDWVVGTRFHRPKGQRIVEVLGARSNGAVGLDPPIVSTRGTGIDQRALLFIFGAAVIGALIGIASVMMP